jgi:hypothetical protein
MGETANHWGSAMIDHAAINVAIVTRNGLGIIKGFPKISKYIVHVSEVVVRRESLN